MLKLSKTSSPQKLFNHDCEMKTAEEDSERKTGKGLSKKIRNSQSLVKRCFFFESKKKIENQCPLRPFLGKEGKKNMDTILHEKNVQSI